jgi:pyridoxal phosphate enzyme (YggS family)
VSESSIRQLLAARLVAVEERIANACGRSGRQRDDVNLIAVTKTISIETAALLPELGLHDLGENRPQELWRKAAALPPSIRWHMVGHLQRNKIERTLPLITLMHSVDSDRLLLELESEASLRSGNIDVLLEVNVSRESSKGGFSPDRVVSLVPLLVTLRHVCVVGLMTMAAPEKNAERCRPTFAELRRIRDRLREELAAPHDLKHLSMGMSNDYEVAIEEGATMVRLGTVLFEGMP